MQQQKFSIRKRLQSFRYAFNGLRLLIRSEHNVRIHLVAAILVAMASYLFQISRTEWIGIVLAIGLVLSAEIFNSAIEKISDFISPEKHETIKVIKDLSAGGVLVSAITALLIAVLVFGERLLVLFR